MRCMTTVECSTGGLAPAGRAALRCGDHKRAQCATAVQHGPASWRGQVWRQDGGHNRR